MAGVGERFEESSENFVSLLLRLGEGALEDCRQLCPAEANSGRATITSMKLRTVKMYQGAEISQGDRPLPSPFTPSCIQSPFLLLHSMFYHLRTKRVGSSQQPEHQSATW